MPVHIRWNDDGQLTPVSFVFYVWFEMVHQNLVEETHQSMHFYSRMWLAGRLVHYLHFFNQVALQQMRR